MSTPTLDGLSVEQLRDLAKRASITADQKQRIKDEKDLVPPVGTEWEYNGRYWVTAKKGRTDRLLLSIPKSGGVIRGWWCGERFSNDRPPAHGGWSAAERDIEEFGAGVIAKLALRVQS